MVGDIGAGAIVVVALVAWLITIDNRLIARINNWIDKAADFRFRRRRESGPDTEAETEASVSGTERETAVSDAVHDEDDGQAVKFVVEDISDSEEEEDGENEQENQNPPDDNLQIEIISEAEKPVEKRDNGDSGPAEGEKNGDKEDFLSSFSEEELQKMFDPRLDLSSYQAPPLTLLEDYKDKWYEVSRTELENNKSRIVSTLANYKIGITKVSVRIGPTVTLYEVVPAPGVRVAQIKKLEADIQRSLAARGVRVVTLPGTNAVGIEVANEKPSVVSMLSVLDDLKFRESKYDLPIALGKTITGEVFTFDLAKMPHLLVAGATVRANLSGLMPYLPLCSTASILQS